LLEKGRNWMKSDLELKHIPVGLRMSGRRRPASWASARWRHCVDAGPAESRRPSPPHCRRLVLWLCLFHLQPAVVGSFPGLCLFHLRLERDDAREGPDSAPSQHHHRGAI
jgi:hypothetical protein